MTEPKHKKRVIVAISDTHLGTTPNITLKNTLKNIRSHLFRHDATPMVVLLCGDLGEGIQFVDDCLRITKGIFPDTPVLGTIGNHDLLPLIDKLDGDLKYDVKFPELFKARDVVYLDAAEPFIIEDTAFIGNIGWYEYGAMNHTHNMYPPEYFQHHKPDSGMIDRFIITKRKDIDFAKECRQRLANQIQMLNGKEEVKRIIVATHHVPFYEEVKKGRGYHYSHDLRNDLYFYHPTMGAELRHEPKVKATISGHIHAETFTEVLNCVGVPIGVYTIGGDYFRPKGLLIDFDNLVAFK